MRDSTHIMSVKISSSDFIKALNAAFNNGEFSFSLDLISQWLNKYPNDIQAEIAKAKIIGKTSEDKVLRILNNIFDKDPENIESLQLLQKFSSDNNGYFESIHYLHTGEADNINRLQPWATSTRAIKQAIKKNDFDKAEKLLSIAISDSPNNLFLALEHAKLTTLIKDTQTIIRILDIYTTRWPKCIKFKLLLANILFISHEESDAVSILHACSRLDPGGIVATRQFGVTHEFLSVFPKDREITFSGEIPTSVAIRFEWSKLPSGKQKVSEKSINNPNEITTKAERKSNIDINRANQSNYEKIYVILTSYTGLKRKYGPKTADVIIQQLDNIEGAIEKNPRWKPIVFIPDLAENTTNFGLKTIGKVDPWKIKLALMDLNSIIKKSEQSIGAVLIVGNDDVIPFHQLPNPTEDSDQYVLSDNPYSTSSSNYLLPEWIVGRLPGEKGNDPGLLLSLIRHIINYHKSANHRIGIKQKIIQLFIRLKNFGRFVHEWLSPPNDFGYSAEVWQRSSIAAFRPLGKGADLRVSPPYESETIDIEKMLQAKSIFFNLHGLSTTNEWYGQRDFSETSTGPDFPVALNTKVIGKIRNNIDLAFTEACFGGFIVDKNIEESIALKLLAIGSQGVVGSSCISYGSVFTPLIGGDLLAFIFWKYIKDGYSFGNALKRAKIGLIKVMMQRQGYLDGEDQKTLLSFNLYGDPLGCLEEIVFLDKQENITFQESDLSLVKDSDGVIQNNYSQHNNVTKDISDLLESYLPGARSAKMRVRTQKVKLAKLLNTDPIRKIGTNLDPKKLTQIVYEKSIHINREDHKQYARVTLDDRGKVIKLAISR